jgi:glycosyltransferase involved in cell wall biosynthesis
VERGHEVTVFTHRTGDLPRREVIEDVRILRPTGLKPAQLPGTTSLAIVFEFLTTLFLLPLAMLWIWRNDVDGIHATAHDMFWISKIISTLLGIPYITFVGYTPSLREGNQLLLESLLEQINFRFCMGETVYCRVPSTIEHIRKANDCELYQIHGVVNSEHAVEAAKSADVDTIRDQWCTGQEDTLLVFVGRLAPKKNPSKALDIIKELPAEYKLVIVGDGPLFNPLQGEINKRGLGQRVFLEGEVPHEQALQVTLAADATLLTSTVEAYPTVAFEGLAMNNTVFAPPVGILAHIDHPRLVVTELKKLSQSVVSTQFDSQHEVDHKTLEQFSIEVYTDCILSEFERLTRRS